MDFPEEPAADPTLNPTPNPTPDFAVSPLSTPPPPPSLGWGVPDVLLVGFIFSLTLGFSMVLGVLLLGRLPHFRGVPTGEFAQEPLFIIPVQLFAYLVSLAFTRMYITLRAHRDFWEAIEWRLGASRVAPLVFGGVALAFIVQVISHFLPVPKGLPIEKFYVQPAYAWLMVVFGVLVAPAVEEIFFRGLLYPALARLFTARERMRDSGMTLAVFAAVLYSIAILVASRWPMAHKGEAVTIIALGIASKMFFVLAIGLAAVSYIPGFPGVTAAIVLTAFLFALLHEGQLARAWAPLLLLFGVGIILTVVRARRHSVAASWIIHMSYNATLFSMMILATHGFRQPVP